MPDKSRQWRILGPHVCRLLQASSVRKQVRENPREWFSFSLGQNENWIKREETGLSGRLWIQAPVSVLEKLRCREFGVILCQPCWPSTASWTSHGKILNRKPMSLHDFSRFDLKAVKHEVLILEVARQYFAFALKWLHMRNYSITKQKKLELNADTN